jgi:hypothetical protein
MSKNVTFLSRLFFVFIVSLFMFSVNAPNAFSATKKKPTAKSAQAKESGTVAPNTEAAILVDNLTDAACHGDMESTKAMVEAGVNPALRVANKYMSPLFYVYKNKGVDNEIFAYLIDHTKKLKMADPFGSDPYGNSILAYARDIEDFRFLESKGANIRAKQYDGRSLVHSMILYISPDQNDMFYSSFMTDRGAEMEKMFLNYMATGELIGSYERANNYFLVLHYLVKKIGATDRDNKGMLPVFYTVDKKYVYLSWYLLERTPRASIQEKDWNLLSKSALLGGNGKLISLVKAAKENKLPKFPIEISEEYTDSLISGQPMATQTQSDQPVQPAQSSQQAQPSQQAKQVSNPQPQQQAGNQSVIGNMLRTGAQLFNAFMHPQ